MDYSEHEPADFALHNFHYKATTDQANRIAEIVVTSPEHTELLMLDALLDSPGTPWPNVAAAKRVAKRRAELMAELFRLTKFEVGRVLSGLDG